MSDEANESYEPSDVQKGEPISVGRLMSATVLTENSVVEHITYEEEGFPVFSGPSFNVIQVPLVEVLNIIKSEDGGELFHIKVVGIMNGDEDVAYKNYIVPLCQLFPADFDDAMTYLITHLAVIKDLSLTRAEILAEIDRLLYAIGQDNS